MKTAEPSEVVCVCVGGPGPDGTGSGTSALWSLSKWKQMFCGSSSSALLSSPPRSSERKLLPLLVFGSRVPAWFPAVTETRPPGEAQLDLLAIGQVHGVLKVKVLRRDVTMSGEILRSEER